MKFLLTISLFLTISPMLKAEVAPEHVEDMLKQMVKENVISQEEAEKARIRLRSMNREQWTQINKQAATVAARSPASVKSSNRIEEVRGIDLDGAQFKQIQDDMKNIVPEYRD